MNKTKIFISSFLLLLVFLTGCSKPLHEDAQPDKPYKEQNLTVNLNSAEENDSPPQQNNIKDEEDQSDSSQREDLNNPNSQIQLEQTENDNKDTTPVNPSFSNVEELAAFFRNPSSNNSDYTLQNTTSTYFYMPAVDFTGFYLHHIDMNDYYIFFRYLPEGNEGPFSFTTGIEFSFKRKKYESAAEALQPIIEDSNCPPTEDGIVYEENWKRACFSAGNHLIQITVPESLNTYEQLKPLCVATRYDVNKGENDSSVIK